MCEKFGDKNINWCIYKYYGYNTINIYENYAWILSSLIFSLIEIAGTLQNSSSTTRWHFPANIK